MVWILLDKCLVYKVVQLSLKLKSMTMGVYSYGPSGVALSPIRMFTL